MTGLARCVLCRREVEYTDVSPKRCVVREGGCGAAGAMRVLRTPGRATGTAVYAPRPRLGVLAAGLEVVLGREAA